jgi:hypothetical protein
MDSVALVIIVALVLLFVTAVFPWLVIATAHLLNLVWELIAGSIFASYGAAGFRLQAWQAKRDLRSQAAGAFRSSSFRSSAWATNAPNHEVMELGALLQQVVGNCNAIHHYAADALVIEDLAELRDHEICLRFRERVVSTEDAILERLQSSEISDVTCAKMAIGVDRMRDICSDCMLLRYRRNNLPPLCHPAAHMGCNGESHQTGSRRRA